MKKTIFLVALIVAGFIPQTMAEMFNDGSYYMVDNDDHEMDYIFLDYWTFNDPGTHLDLVNGGKISELEAWKISSINMTGGLVENLNAFDNSVVSISGGSVQWDIAVADNAVITMSGGTVGNRIRAYGNGILYMEGSSFEVDGTVLANGSKLSDFGTFVENGNSDYYKGTITGLLADGSVLNCEFMIFNTDERTADIVIIPEPCSIILLGLGCLALRKRKA